MGSRLCSEPVLYSVQPVAHVGVGAHPVGITAPLPKEFQCEDVRGFAMQVGLVWVYWAECTPLLTGFID